MEEPPAIGEWKKVAQLGAGGFGVVTLWRNDKTNDYFAIKKCKMAMASSLTSRQKERWKHEVEIMKQIKNAHIVSFKELPETFYRELNRYNPTKLPLLSMEYCSEGNLRTHIRTSENMMGLQEMEVRSILLDICNGIQYLHGMDITHRDIKPENIVMQLCNERPNKVIYKIIDLGYAKELGTIVSFVGTLPYLAPEIFHTENYTKNVDYWSLGMTAYEIITGDLPFLPTLEPPRRFEYIKQKSEDDICIYFSRKGTVEFSKEILKRVWISSVLKKNIEDWLRLVLQFDPNKRGRYRSETRDVLLELKAILAKKIVQVLFVCNLTVHSYEVTEFSTFGDLKKLVGGTSPEGLVVLHELQNDIYYDNDRILECIDKVDHKTEFYIFSRKSYINTEKSISFPSALEQLHKSRNDFKIQEIHELTLQLIFFIRTEKELLNFFNKSIYAQIALTEHIFEVFLSKKLFEKIRNDLNHLIAEIDCYNALHNGSLNSICNRENQCLNNYRKLLRQTKELIENVNGMMEKFLQFSHKKHKLLTLIDSTKKVLEGNNLNEILASATNVHKRIKQCIQLNVVENQTQSNLDRAPMHIELARILSQVIKMWRKNVIANREISEFTLVSLKLQKSLKKHYTWCMALNKEIYRVSKELNENLNQSVINAKITQESLVSITFPNNLAQELSEANALTKENMAQRYAIQEKLDDTFLSLRKIHCEVLMLYNGVSVHYSDI